MKNYLFIVLLSLATSLALGACVSSPSSVEKTLYIAPQTANCPDTSTRECLQVKENPEDEYTTALESIEGFEFVPGYEYELRVVEESSADGSEDRLRLIEVVRKLPAFSPLKDSQWNLASYANAAGELIEVLPGTQVTLEFADGKLSGSAGCNSYFGDYHADSTSLTADSIGSTEMFCNSPEGVMEQESVYLGALSNAASYTIEDETLTVMNTDGVTILIFNLLQPVTLTGETWEMVAVSNGQGEITPVLQGTSVSAVFSQDGKLSGSAGCNQYGSAYMLDEDRITIPAPAATRMFCSEPEGVMEQESAFLQALESAASFDIRQGILELYDASGALVAMFQEQQPAEQPVQFSLAGTNWVWREFQSGSGEVIAPQNPEKYSLTFKEGGVLEIQADCNFVEGTYEAVGDSLFLHPGDPGPALCSPASLSDRYLQLIGDAASYQLTEGGDLAIGIIDDAGILFFRLAE